MLTEKEKNKIIEWYNNYCYNHKIDYNIYDINAKIDSNINIDENINIIENDLNKLIQTDVKLQKDIKENIQEIKEEQRKSEEEKKIYGYKETAKNEIEFIKRVCFNSTHIAILGMRREGKTSLGFEILRWHKELTNKEIVTYRFPKPELLPKWIKNINSIEEIGCNQVILVDESSNDFDQYSYQKQSNRFLSQLLKRAGQTGTSFIFIDHNSGFLNKNMLRMIDIWILKKNTEFAIDDERKYIRNLYSKMLWKPKINEYFVHYDGHEGILKFEMPEFFTKELSMGYDLTLKEVINSSELINVIKGDLPTNAKDPKNAKIITR